MTSVRPKAGVSSAGGVLAGWFLMLVGVVGVDVGAGCVQFALGIFAQCLIDKNGNVQVQRGVNNVGAID
jgi:hypothetical protein